MKRVLAAIVLTGVVAGIPATAAAAPAPEVRELVVFKSGKSKQATVRAGAVRAPVGRRGCAIGKGTALAALIRLRPGRLVLEDFGRCSRDPADAGQLYVRSMRGEREAGTGGWVYKVGNRLAVAGAGDPRGAFGRGRLRGGQRVTWFYCRMAATGCQRTLVMRLSAPGGGLVEARVTGYDDEGRGRPAAGALVAVPGGGPSAVADAEGMARLTLPVGRRRLTATLPRAVRSFTETVAVR